MDKITKLVQINVNTQSIEQLDKLIEDANKELKHLNDSQKAYNITEAETNELIKQQTALEKQLEAAQNERSSQLEVNLENEKQLRVNAIKQTVTNADEQNKQLANLNIEYLNKRLETVEKGSKAELKLSSALIDAENKKMQNTAEATQKKTEQLAKATIGIGAGFSIAKSAALSFGGLTGEELEKLEGQVTGLISLTNNVKDVSEGLNNGYKLVGSTISNNTTLSKIFGLVSKNALLVSGIGAFVIALGLAVTYWDDIVKAADKFSKTSFKDIKSDVEDFTKTAGTIENVFNDVNNEILKTDKLISNLREVNKKEAIIKNNQFEIDLQKAQGNDVLDLERKNIDARLDLLNFRLSKVKAGSEEETKLLDEANKEQVNIETNKKEQEEKIFNDRLLANQKFYNKQSKLLTDALKELLNQTGLNENEILEINQDIEQKRFELAQKTLAKEISIRKSHNDDITALQATYAQNELDNQTKLQDEKAAKLQRDLETEKQLRLLELQKNFDNEAEFNEQKEGLEAEFSARRLNQIESDSVEGLQIQIAANDKAIKEKINYQNRQIALDKYLNDKEISTLQKSVANTQSSINSRLDANDKLHDKLISNINEEQKAYQKGTLEYEQLQDKRKQADEDYTNTTKALTQQRIQQVAQYTQAVAGILNNVVALYDQLQQAKIDKANKDIDDLQSRNDAITEQIKSIDDEFQKSIDRRNELEKSAQSARGERAAINSQQLEDEREAQKKLQDEKSRLNKVQIENEKKLEKEKARVAKLEIERKKVDKTNAITQATINTAVGFSQALAQGGFAGIALGALVAAAGAVEIALIASQPINGYEKGGYTNKSSDNKKVSGFVHDNEFVVPSHVLNSPKGSYLVDQLEQMRTNGFASGGYTNLDIDRITSLAKQSTNIQDLSKVRIVVGVDQITKQQSNVEVIQNSAGF